VDYLGIMNEIICDLETGTSMKEKTDHRRIEYFSNANKLDNVQQKLAFTYALLESIWI